jgi:hypothetical protein
MPTALNLRICVQKAFGSNPGLVGSSLSEGPSAFPILGDIWDSALKYGLKSILFKFLLFPS